VLDGEISLVMSSYVQLFYFRYCSLFTPIMLINMSESVCLSNLHSLFQRSDWFLDSTDKFTQLYQQVATRILTQSHNRPISFSEFSHLSDSRLHLSPRVESLPSSFTKPDPILPSYLKFSFPADLI